MKTSRILLFITFLFCLSAAKSQHALENVIVEKYYITDANDTVRSAGGPIPVGSTTYRIFLDMLPGYRFQAAYGKDGHELKLETTTLFFNNGDIGNEIPNVIPRRSLTKNTVMLDSWLSAGAAGEEYYGVLKEQDDTLETVVHEKQFLKSKNKAAGIPLTQRDGLLAGDGVPRPAFFGIDSMVPVFFNKTKGSRFSTSNGAWGCLGGSVGPDSLGTNRVLIAQVTTDGDFSFELNIQIGKADEAQENYVAKNPVGQEITMPFLTYTSKQPKLTAAKSKMPKKTNNTK